MPQLASADVHQALQYLAAVNHAGYQPSAAELNAYGEQPGRTSHVVGSASLAAQFDGLARTFAEWVGRRELEAYSAHFLRLKWASNPTGGFVITELGEAVLAALDAEANANDSEFLQTVLGADDPIAYARAIAVLADLGPVMIVDPYVKLDQLPDLLRLSNVTRILSSTERKPLDQKATPFAAAATMAKHDVGIRLDEGNKLHDRYFVPDDGLVYMISTSMNSISASRISVITPLDEQASAAVRAAQEAIWDGASPVADPEIAEASKPTLDATHSTVGGAPSDEPEQSLG